MKQLELSELESLLRVAVRPLGFSGEGPSPGVGALAGGVGTGLLTELAGTGRVSFVVDPGRFDALPDGDGVGVELDWFRGMAIFIRRPALSELITLNCCCCCCWFCNCCCCCLSPSAPVLCLLLVLLVDATDVDESESDDESDPSSESDEEEDEDDDDSGDFPGGFESTGVVFTVVITRFEWFFDICVTLIAADHVAVPTCLRHNCLLFVLFCVS